MCHHWLNRIYPTARVDPKIPAWAVPNVVKAVGPDNIAKSVASCLERTDHAVVHKELISPSQVSCMSAAMFSSSAASERVRFNDATLTMGLIKRTGI